MLRDIRPFDSTQYEVIFDGSKPYREPKPLPEPHREVHLPGTPVHRKRTDAKQYARPSAIQMKVLAALRKEGTITSARIVHVTGLKQSQVQNALIQLRLKRKVIATGDPGTASQRYRAR